MSQVQHEAAPTHREPAAGPPGGTDNGNRHVRPSLVTAVAIALVAGVLMAWWLASTPRLEHFRGSGVQSDDLDLVEITGPDATMVVLPNDPSGDTRIMFDVVNRGPVAVTVQDVWPDESVPPCFWHPDVREVRQSPNDLWHDGLPASPAVGAVIEPGDAASFWLVGSVDAPACRMEALTSLGSFDVVVSALGRTSTVPIVVPDLRIGLTDDPAGLVDSYGVEVVPARG